tara:strand:- start:2 stop:730 length:729 start_codon:yes stop_codon:yes gene_type:complete
MFNIKGKNILVVGASRGIGETISKSLINEEVNVISTARSKVNYSCNYFQFDITKQSSIDKLKSYILENCKTLDGIVFAAAKSLPASKDDSSSLQHPNLFNELICTNLLSIYNCIFHLESLIENNSSIIMISSIGAHLAFPRNTGYQVSKAGLEALSRSLSYELAHRNIRTNSIILGYFKTKMTEISYSNPDLRAERTKRTLLNRWGDVEDVTGAVNFLLSDKASYITGTSIVIDGGWLAKGL